MQDIPLSPRHPSYAALAEIEAGLTQFRDRPVQIIWGMRDWCFTPHFLDRQYTAFGKLIKGDDVLEKIATTPTHPPDRPNKKMVVESIKIVPADSAK